MSKAYFRQRNSRPEINVKVASSIEELMQVFAIRTAVYIAEQSCPYFEEFDGNDFTATHLLAHVDGEPAATIRLRYFGDFVKHERTTVRKEFRGSGVANRIIQYSIDFARKKGFARLYGHAAKGLVPYWQRYGFEPCGEAISFSDLEFVPVVCELGSAGESLTMDSDDMVLVRPEGRWHVPGILERPDIIDQVMDRASVDTADVRR